MRYNGAIDNLLQGVSQQSEKERRPEQVNEQINCTSSIINGLGKRPGTYNLKRYNSGFFPSEPKFYSYDRGDLDERYLFAVGEAGIIAIDLLTGSQVPVNFEADASYLDVDHKDDLVFYTIADTTFVLNKQVVPETGEPTVTGDEWNALIYCKRANWGKTYEIVIDGETVSYYTTPATVTLAVSSDEQEVSKDITLKTTDVIAELLPDLQTWADSEGVNIEWYGDVIYLHKSVGDYSVLLLDDNNGADFISIGKSISQYSDLPEIAANGFKVQVTGIDKTAINDYYVEFNAENTSGIGRGVWEESAGFGIDTNFVASTMPHKLVREADGEFYFRNIEWVPRTSGDDNTNPVPSFVGSTISDINTYQGRLVLTTEENQCASVTFDYFNFWSDSVIQDSDDDPIDTASSDNQVTNLHHSLVFNSSLISFSDKAQFIHPGDSPFTSKTFSLSSKARYQSNINCEPVASANSVFFPYDFGRYTGLQEMRIENVTGNLSIQNTTEQCKKYIKGSAVQIETSTDYNIVVVRTDTSDDLYVYEWYDRDNKRLQAAWHKWVFDAPVEYMKIISDKLYLLIKRGVDYCIEYLDLADQNTEGIEFPVRLDLLESIEPTETTENYVITPTITDYQGVNITDLVVLGGNSSGLEGTELAFDIVGDTILVSKDIVQETEVYITDDADDVLLDDADDLIRDSSTLKFVVGIPYASECEITNPYVRDQFDKPKTLGRLRLGSMRFNVADTGHIEFEVTTGTNVYTKVYNTRIIDERLFRLNAPPSIVETTVPVSIRSDRDRCSVKIKSDKHLPFYVSDIDWSGEYYEAGRRTR